MTSRELPNPADFGDSQCELRRLGAAFRDWLRSPTGDAAAADITHQIAQAFVESDWLRFEPGKGVRVFFTEARRCALEGKLDLAAKHYKKWVLLAGRDAATVNREIRRLKGPAAASFEKRQRKIDRYRQAVDSALDMLAEGEAGMSASTLARRVAVKTGIEFETVRRYFRASPFLLEAIRSRRRPRMKS